MWWAGVGVGDNKLKHKARLLADVPSLLFAFISLWTWDYSGEGDLSFVFQDI